jgi:hypothetical protein
LWQSQWLVVLRKTLSFAFPSRFVPALSLARKTQSGNRVPWSFLLRVKYRQAITEQVAAIIRACCGRKETVARLRRWAGKSVMESDRSRFVAAAEETLAGIHEGNFAFYRIRPSEFMSWKAAWTSAGITKA